MNKKILSLILMICLMIPCALGIVACDKGDPTDPNADKISLQTFTWNTTNSVITDDMVTFNRADSNEFTSSTGTYFGETDKNLDWDGSQIKLSFDLDLSVMQENSLAIFVLSFNEKITENQEQKYDHVNEVRLSIVKSNDKFYVRDCYGMGWSADDIDIAKETDKYFTSNTANASFTLSYNKDTKTLSYTTEIAGIKVIETQKEITNFDTAKTSSEKIEGLRNFYLANTNVDGIKLSNLKLTSN